MKFISALTAVLFGVVSTHTTSAAQPFLTLAQLKTQLDARSRSANTKGKGSEEAPTSIAYILGAADAFEIANALCFPSNTSGENIVAAVTAYLHDHAKDEQVAECLKVGCEASWGVLQALRPKFPCVNVP